MNSQHIYKSQALLLFPPCRYGNGLTEGCSLELLLFSPSACMLLPTFEPLLLFSGLL